MEKITDDEGRWWRWPKNKLFEFTSFTVVLLDDKQRRLFVTWPTHAVKWLMSQLKKWAMVPPNDLLESWLKTNFVFCPIFVFLTFVCRYCSGTLKLVGRTFMVMISRIELKSFVRKTSTDIKIWIVDNLYRRWCYFIRVMTWISYSLG